jgi:hypothetical protein
MTSLTTIAERDPNIIARLYRGAQATEGLARVKRLVDRLMPPRRGAHGFYEPERFFAEMESGYGAWRRALSRSLLRRITSKIERRDADLTAIEMAERMER